MPSTIRPLLEAEPMELPDFRLYTSKTVSQINLFFLVIIIVIIFCLRLLTYYRWPRIEQTKHMFWNFQPEFKKHNGTLVQEINVFHNFGHKTELDENQIKFSYKVSTEPAHWIWFVSYPIWLMERTKIMNQSTTILSPPSISPVRK